MPPYRMDVTTDHYPIFFLLLSECIQQERLNKLKTVSLRQNAHPCYQNDCDICL